MSEMLGAEHRIRTTHQVGRTLRGNQEISSRASARSGTIPDKCDESKNWKVTIHLGENPNLGNMVDKSTEIFTTTGSRLLRDHRLQPARCGGWG